MKFKMGDHVTHNDKYIEAGVEDLPNTDEHFIDGVIIELYPPELVKLDGGELINEYWLKLKRM